LEHQKHMTYTQKEKIFPPIYENKTFHSVRNMIIKQVLEMGSVVSEIVFDEQIFLMRISILQQKQQMKLNLRFLIQPMKMNLMMQV